VKAGVDDFHPCIFEGVNYNFGASVMPVQTWLGYQDPDSFSFRGFAHSYSPSSLAMIT